MIITATEITRTGYFYKYTCSDWSIFADAGHELFCVIGDFYASVIRDPWRRGNKITADEQPKSVEHLNFDIIYFLLSF